MLIRSMEAQHETIGKVASNGNLRKAIKRAKKDPWVFKGLQDDCGEAEVPQESPQCDIVYIESERGTHCQNESRPFIDQRHSYLNNSGRLTYLIAKYCIGPSQYMHLVSDERSKLPECLEYTRMLFTLTTYRGTYSGTQFYKLIYRTCITLYINNYNWTIITQLSYYPCKITFIQVHE